MARLIIAIVAILAAGSIFFLYTKPAYDNVQSLQGQIAQYNAALDKANELQQLKQTLLSKYNAFDPGAIARLEKLLPDNVDNVKLILDLDNLASRYGLSLQNVDVSSAGAPGASNQQPIGAIGRAESRTYDSLTMTFETAGTYENFLQFMQSLESSLRILDVVSLKIGSGGQSGAVAQKGVFPVYSYNVTIRTYWLK